MPINTQLNTMGGRQGGNISGDDSHKNRSQNERRGTMDNTIASEKIATNMGKYTIWNLNTNICIFYRYTKQGL